MYQLRLLLLRARKQAAGLGTEAISGAKYIPTQENAAGQAKSVICCPDPKLAVPCWNHVTPDHRSTFGNHLGSEAARLCPNQQCLARASDEEAVRTAATNVDLEGNERQADSLRYSNDQQPDIFTSQPTTASATEENFAGEEGTCKHNV